MLASKEIVNSAMITLLELTDQMTRSERWRVDVVSAGKASFMYACYLFQVLFTVQQTRINDAIYSAPKFGNSMQIRRQSQDRLIFILMKTKHPVHIMVFGVVTSYGVVILWGIGAKGHGQRARLCCRLNI